MVLACSMCGCVEGMTAVEGCTRVGAVQMLRTSGDRYL